MQFLLGGRIEEFGCQILLESFQVNFFFSLPNVDFLSAPIPHIVKSLKLVIPNIFFMSWYTKDSTDHFLCRHRSLEFLPWNFISISHFLSRSYRMASGPFRPSFMENVLKIFLIMTLKRNGIV